MRTSRSKLALCVSFFLRLTSFRAWIHAITRKLRNKPLLDIVGGVIEDYEFLWDQYYFPTATM
jgi:hypothetical protein